MGNTDAVRKRGGHEAFAIKEKLGDDVGIKAEIVRNELHGVLDHFFFGLSGDVGINASFMDRSVEAIVVHAKSFFVRALLFRKSREFDP